jgi:membrane-associated protease RseP (regulator of RpoE activity)
MPDGATGSVEPGYLGLVADDRDTNGQGVLLKEVFPDAPAALGGLQKEDLITSVNGQQVQTAKDMMTIMQPLGAGAKVKFDIQRQGAAQTVEVTLGRRPPPDQRRYQNFGRLPDDNASGGASGAMPSGSSSVSGSSIGVPAMSAPSTSSRGAPLPPQRQSPQRTGTPMPRDAISGPRLGLSTMAVTEQDRQRLRLQSTAGAHVVGRAVNSPAEKANIPLDAIITAVNGRAVNSPDDLSALVLREAGKGNIELTYLYNGYALRATIALNTSGGSPTAGAAAGSAGAPSSTFVPRNPGMTSPAMPPAGNDRYAPNATTDAQRIEALERRVQELEQKVRSLEERLRPGA